MDIDRGKIGTYVLVILILVVFLFPLYWVFASSFKPYEALLTGSKSLIPHNFTIQNYIEVFTADYAGKNVLSFIKNSLMVSSIATGIGVGLAIPAAYAISDYEFRGQNFLLASMLLIFLFPTVLIATPLMYQVKAVFGWTDNIYALALIYSAITAPISVWLITSFFKSVPEAVKESAALDGASKLRILKDIVVPQASSGIFAAGAFSFITAWGEYLYSALLITDDSLSTVPVGIATYLGSQYIEWGRLSAATFVTTIIVVIIFLPFARKFLKGFMARGTRG